MTTKPSSLTVHRSADRGHADHGWLKSSHSFSFGDYHDPARMGFRSLRVINDDQVAPGGGFPTHPHRDMEIFSYVLEGALAHEDSLGNRRELKPGQIQLMSAGSGITHSEFNPSATEPLKFLQIWIQPRERGLTPGYTEWHPAPESAGTPKVLVISPDGREASARINQDAFIHRIRLAPGESVDHTVEDGRGCWVQIARGAVMIGDTRLDRGDAASTEYPGALRLTAPEDTEALLFDLG